MGGFSSSFTLLGSAILLLDPVVLGTGAQSVTADRDIRRSDNLNKYEGVQ